MLQNLAKKAFNLRLQVNCPAGVRHYIIGTPTLLVKWHLRFFPFCPLCGIPAPVGLNPLPASLRRGLHEDHRVALLIQTGLKQQRGIDDQGRGFRRRVIELLTPPGFDPRMGQAFKAFSLGGIIEHDVRDLAAIDFTSNINDLIPPPFTKRVLDVRIAQSGTPRGIGVNDEAAEFGKNLRDGGFAAADAAGKSDDRWFRWVHAKRPSNRK